MDVDVEKKSGRYVIKVNDKEHTVANIAYHTGQKDYKVRQWIREGKIKDEISKRFASEPGRLLGYISTPTAITSKMVGRTRAFNMKGVHFTASDLSAETGMSTRSILDQARRGTLAKNLSKFITSKTKHDKAYAVTDIKKGKVRRKVLRYLQQSKRPSNMQNIMVDERNYMGIFKEKQFTFDANINVETELGLAIFHGAIDEAAEMYGMTSTPYVSLKFEDPNNSRHRVWRSVWRDTFEKFSEDVYKLQEGISLGGSDRIEHEVLKLDPSAFVLRSYVPKSGGGKSHHCRVFKTLKIKALDCVPKTCKNVDNNCILYALKQGLSLRQQVRTMRNECGITHIAPISAPGEDLKKISNTYDVRVMVYDADANLIHATEPKTNEVRLLLHEDHYYLIEQFESEKKKKVAKPKEVDTGREKEERYFFFDYETVYCPLTGQIVPYSVQYRMDDKHGNKLYPLNEDVKIVLNPNCSIEMVNDLHHHVKDEVDKDGVEKRQTYASMIGYNSSRFDNFLLFNDLLKVQNGEMPLPSGEKPPIFPKSSAQVSDNSLLFMTVMKKHQMFDLFRFTLCSLADACKNFKTEHQKDDKFKHENAQYHYELGGTRAIKALLNPDDIKRDDFIDLRDEYLYYRSLIPEDKLDEAYIYYKKHGFAEVYRYLKEDDKDYEKYFTNDILAMRELFYKVNDVQGDLTKYKTLSQMSFKKWKDGLIEKGITDEVDVDYDEATNNFIREAIYAGRCEAFHEYYKSDEHHAFVDIVSQYPYVMSNRRFPIGQPRNTSCYKHGKMGIYECEILHQSRKRPKFNDYYPVVIPLRITPENKKDYPDESVSSLKWSYRGHIKRAVITSIDIEKIKEIFGDSSIKVKGGIYWEYTREDLFTDFIKPIFAEKQRQDRLRDTGSPDFNPALRHMKKIEINSLSGKMLQRIYHDSTAIIGSPSEFNSWLGSVDCTGHEVKRTTLGDSGYHIVSGTKKNAYIKTNNKKPVHIGVFIYSYAREYLYTRIFEKCHPVYCDTDSCLMSYGDYEKLYSEDTELFETKALGNLSEQLVEETHKSFKYPLMKTMTEEEGDSFLSTNITKQDNGLLKLSPEIQMKIRIITKKCYHIQVQHGNTILCEKGGFKGVSKKYNKYLTLEELRELLKITKEELLYIDQSFIASCINSIYGKNYKKTKTVGIEFYDHYIEGTPLFVFQSQMVKSLFMRQNYLVKLFCRDSEVRKEVSSAMVVTHFEPIDTKEEVTLHIKNDD